MGEHRVMELLLQFIMGGGGINSRTIGGSASQLWQSSGEVGWGPHFLSVFPVQTLLIPAATSKKEICLRVETQRLVTPQASRSSNARLQRPPQTCQVDGKWKKANPHHHKAWLATTTSSL